MPRNPTPKQRQASIDNGKRSRGPVTPDGKKKSSQRGRKWGLRAQTVALEHESADRSERCNQWHDYYQPQSPAAIHKTNQCARASLLADRADAYQQAELEKQVRETKEAWHRKQLRRQRYLTGQMRKDVYGTMEKLKSFGAGLYFIIRVTRAHARRAWEAGISRAEGSRNGPVVARVPTG